MRILGIDPGSRKVGFGVIDVVGAHRHLVHAEHGVIRLNDKHDLILRIKELAQHLQKIVSDTQPNHAVLEDVFMGDNARSALILGQARGAVLAMLGLANIPVINLSATRVKSAVTGTGCATKEQVGKMVQAILKLEKKPAEDAGDALALAICYGHQLMSSKSCALVPTVKAVSDKKKQKALYDLAVSQGRIS
jgi:crossover junction endodeoxyribonuclease RuvC